MHERLEDLFNELQKEANALKDENRAQWEMSNIIPYCLPQRLCKSDDCVDGKYDMYY